MRYGVAILVQTEIEALDDREAYEQARSLAATAEDAVDAKYKSSIQFQLILSAEREERS